MPSSDSHNTIQSMIQSRVIDSNFTDSALFIANRGYQFYRMSVVYTAAAGSAATLRVRLCNSGTAPSSGTVISGTVDLNSTVNTVFDAYSNGASPFIAAGQYLSLDFAGSIGSLANCCVTVECMAA